MNVLKAVAQTTVEPKSLALWWLGQSGYIFKTSEGLRLAIDPYLSGIMEGRPEDFPRLVPPPISPTELDVEVLFVTHAHGDHLDLAIFEGKKKEDIPVVVGPPSVGQALAAAGIECPEIHILRAGQSLQLGSLKVTATFCIPNEEMAIDSIGYVVEFPDGISLYHTGDTDFHPFLYYLSRFKLDLVLTCINGKYGNMGIQGAAELTRYLKPNVVIPHHYGMFALNDADPYEFLGSLKKSFAESEVGIPSIGETNVYCPVPLCGRKHLKQLDRAEEE